MASSRGGWQFVQVVQFEKCLARLPGWRGQGPRNLSARTRPGPGTSWRNTGVLRAFVDRGRGQRRQAQGAMCRDQQAATAAAAVSP